VAEPRGDVAGDSRWRSTLGGQDTSSRRPQAATRDHPKATAQRSAHDEQSGSAACADNGSAVRRQAGGLACRSRPGSGGKGSGEAWDPQRAVEVMAEEAGPATEGELGEQVRGVDRRADGTEPLLRLGNGVGASRGEGDEARAANSRRRGPRVRGRRRGRPPRLGAENAAPFPSYIASARSPPTATTEVARRLAERAAVGQRCRSLHQQF